MKKLLALLLTVLLTALSAQAEGDNYRTFYQIFVGSFSDSSRDGIGDLGGVISRMDYLNDGNPDSPASLGVDAIWLSPIFASPSYHKYDTTDYYAIDWRFGTQDTLRELIALCKERDVKLILDLVINHTSSQHEWFLQFKQARQTGDVHNPYYDFYACVPEAQKRSGATYQKLSGVDCWYECNFSPDMPELNFDSPAVWQAMLDVAAHYLDMGVDGFRFDAVKYIYYGDTARNVDFWQRFMQALRRINPDVLCVGECWSGESEILAYYPAMDCFNFAMASAEGVTASAAKGFSLSKYTKYIETFQNKLLAQNPDGKLFGFLSNHDMDRIAGAFVLENSMRMAANLYLLAPGCPVLYYGEEIGLRGSRGSESTDANRRLAMPWGDGDLVRDPVGSTYPADKQISHTVSDQLADENSLLAHYRTLIGLRSRYPAIARGSYTSLKTGEKNFGGFRVDWQGEVLGIFHNNGTEPISYDLSALDGCAFTELCGFAGAADAALNGHVLTLGAQTSAVLK